MPCVAREQTKNCTGHDVSERNGIKNARAGYIGVYALCMMCTFDIVHERCAKFNTRRMARMGTLYYTILY